jgi:hypothetical protein
VRHLLPPSLLCLALFLLLNARAGVYDHLLPERGAGPAERTAATRVRIFSQGRFFRSEVFDRRRQPQAIVVDGRLREHKLGVPGLRVATFTVGGTEPRFDNFDLAESAEDVAEFTEHVRALPVGACLAMGVYHNIQPPEEEVERERILSELFRELGAQAEPAAQRNASWAFLCVRRPGGWVPVAETFSPTKGVMLARTLTDDLERLDGTRPELVIDRRVRSPLLLIHGQGETPLGTFARARRGYASAFVVNDVQRDGVFAPPPYGPRGQGVDPPETMVQFYVRLGANPTFEAELGMLSYHHGASQGAEFEVRVQSEVAGRREIGLDPNEPDAWLPWTVDLSPWSDRWVKLELVTRCVGLEPGEVPEWAEPLVWGSPTIVFEDHGGVEPAPTEWELFLQMLDQDADGILAPAEPEVRIMLLDRDKDRRISLEEWPRFATSVARYLDEDRDGMVSAKEAEGLYRRLFEL